MLAGAQTIGTGGSRPIGFTQTDSYTYLPGPDSNIVFTMGEGDEEHPEDGPTGVPIYVDIYYC